MVKSAVPVVPLIVVADRLAVTPAGMVPKLRFTLEVKPFCATALTVVLNAAPAVKDSELTSVLRVKPGTPTTVRSKLMLCDTVPPAALMTNLY